MSDEVARKMAADLGIGPPIKKDSKPRDTGYGYGYSYGHDYGYGGYTQASADRSDLFIRNLPDDGSGNRLGEYGYFPPHADGEGWGNWVSYDSPKGRAAFPDGPPNKRGEAGKRQPAAARQAGLPFDDDLGFGVVKGSRRKWPERFVEDVEFALAGVVGDGINAELEREDIDAISKALHRMMADALEEVGIFWSGPASQQMRDAARAAVTDMYVTRGGVTMKIKER